MNERERIPFLLRYEEYAAGDAVIDGFDEDYYFEPDKNGMAIRRRFIPWESYATLKSLEA